MSAPESKIVTKMVSLAGKIASRVDHEFAPLVAARDMLRTELAKSGDILPFAQKLDPTALPASMCCVDGARIREQMYAVDMLYACAAVKDARFVTEKPAVEAQVWADAMRHMDGTELLVQTAMGSLEVVVASRAPHQVVALDGAFLTPIIALQAALFAKQPDVRDAAADLLLDPDLLPIQALSDLMDKAPGSLLALTKSDSAVKYTSALSTRFDMRIDVSDRVMASQVLKPGELLAPRPLSELAGQSLNEVKGSAKVRRAAEALGTLVDKIAGMAQSGRMHTTYFKPYGAHTVIRFEFISASSDRDVINADAARYAAILNADTIAPHMMEPFCQYAVDAEVKTISSGARALKDTMFHALPADKAASYRTLLAEGYRT